MSAPLEGLRVLTMAEQLPGPFATLLLADLGADVIIVERPAGGDPSRTVPWFFEALNRNKRSVALDLKRPEGVAVLRRLAADADVVLEGFRPGVVARLGVDHVALRELAPALVYVSISGFGQSSPYAGRAAHDLSYQAMAGLLHDVGPDQPATASLTLADLTAGLYAVIGVLTGLARRGLRGEGSFVDVAMLDCALSLLTAKLVPVVNETGPPDLPAEPGYGVFATADGRLLTLSITHEDRFWSALCQVTDLGELAGLRASARVSRTAELRGRLAESIGKRPLEDWCVLLVEADVPFGPVRRLEDLIGDQHVAARALMTALEQEPGITRRHLRQPLMVDGVGWGPERGSPQLGEHTAEVLVAAGYRPDQVAELIDSGVAAGPSAAPVVLR